MRLTSGPSWNSPLIAFSNGFALRRLNMELLNIAQKSELLTMFFTESAAEFFGYLKVNLYYHFRL